MTAYKLNREHALSWLNSQQFCIATPIRSAALHCIHVSQFQGRLVPGCIFSTSWNLMNLTESEDCDRMWVRIFAVCLPSIWIAAFAAWTSACHVREALLPFPFSKSWMVPPPQVSDPPRIGVHQGLACCPPATTHKAFSTWSRTTSNHVLKFSLDYRWRLVPETLWLALGEAFWHISRHFDIFWHILTVSLQFTAHQIVSRLSLPSHTDILKVLSPGRAFRELISDNHEEKADPILRHVLSAHEKLHIWISISFFYLSLSLYTRMCIYVEYIYIYMYIDKHIYICM